MPTVYVPKKGWTIWDVLKAMRDPGWKRGRAKGAYVAGDLSELKKTILLCPTCKHGFDWKKHGYYSVFHYDQMYVRGQCDVCRGESMQLSMYLHEAHRAKGDTWTPRKDLAKQRRMASIAR